MTTADLREPVKRPSSAYAFEHFEIASYRSLIAFGQQLGEQQRFHFTRTAIEEQQMATGSAITSRALPSSSPQTAALLPEPSKRRTCPRSAARTCLVLGSPGPLSQPVHPPLAPGPAMN